MAVKQQAEVTVTDRTDADRFTTWYRLTTSPSLPPAPAWATDAEALSGEAASASAGWCRTEPGYSASGGTPYLYECEQTVWGDGKCDWSAVQLSASFEAAKAAYDEARSAKRTATGFISTVGGGATHFHADDDSWDPETGDSVRITDQVDVVRGGRTVARFGAGEGGDEVVLGGEGGCRALVGPGSFRMEDRDGGAYALFSDIRGGDSAATVIDLGGGVLRVAESFRADECGAEERGGRALTAVQLSFPVLEGGELSVRANGSTVAGMATYAAGPLGALWLAPKDPSDIAGKTLRVVYDVDAAAAKAFTLGSRAQGGSGALSRAFGRWVSAPGYCAQAEGVSSEASGAASHAQGYGTVAASRHQTALGRYNEVDAGGTYAVIVGNGDDGALSGTEARSNAATLDWSGNLALAGGLSLGGGEALPTYEIDAAWEGNEAAFKALLPRRPCVALSSDGYALHFDSDPSTD